MSRRKNKFFWHWIFTFFVICALAPGPVRSAEQKSPAIDQVWSALEGEPFLTFQRARERFLSENYSDAARFVRKGAAFLWLETEQADSRNLSILEGSAAMLAKVADQVEAGEMASGRSLEVAFAKAHLAMAKHYSSLSKRYEGLEDVQNSLRAMYISAGHLLAASYWSPEGLEEDEIADVRTTRSSLNNGEKGGGGVGKTLAEAFRKLNQGMEKISKHIRFYEAEQE